MYKVESEDFSSALGSLLNQFMEKHPEVTRYESNAKDNKWKIVITMRKSKLQQVKEKLNPTANTTSGSTT